MASGAQAIAALAYGTESIPRVDKICGPGNIFVTLAKRAVYGDVGIDSMYGPTETVVVADDEADPVLCAVDLIAQAEHDEIATPILICISRAMARRSPMRSRRLPTCRRARRPRRIRQPRRRRDCCDDRRGGDAGQRLRAGAPLPPGA
jgi:histidinol dehydrogenase